MIRLHPTFVAPSAFTTASRRETCKHAVYTICSPRRESFRRPAFRKTRYFHKYNTKTNGCNCAACRAEYYMYYFRRGRESQYCYDNNAQEGYFISARPEEARDTSARETFNTASKLKSTFTTWNLLLLVFSADKGLSPILSLSLCHPPRRS